MALLPNLLPSSTTTLQTLTISICLLSKMASAQNGDGGAASGNLPGTSAGNGAALGAAGPSQSSANLSIGATVAIAVIVGIAVILGSKFNPPPLPLLSEEPIILTISLQQP